MDEWKFDTPLNSGYILARSYPKRVKTCMIGRLRRHRYGPIISHSNVKGPRNANAAASSIGSKSSKIRPAPFAFDVWAYSNGRTFGPGTSR
jgi:hypothetical protein